ncbi:MAG: response regulator transcription factor [Bacilli bacterium]|nr:response regulator transcription factor [Bacilli bacterium]MBQ7241003.1 response regulator transcription factor [Bacilli bacterium]
MRILIVEDEESLAELVANRLKKEKYTVDIANDGEEGLYNALEDLYDLIILDIMLPNINGIDILKEIKKNNIKSKVIMLTAKSELEDKLLGFSEGANDYIPKPFHIDEVVARVNAQLRTEKVKNNNLEFGDLILDLKTSDIINKNNNEKINIINKEFQLLEYFMNNPNQVLSKEMIYDKVWGLDNDSISNNLEAYLSFIRKKLKLINSNVQIKALRNLGYKMEYKDERTK